MKYRIYRFLIWLANKFHSNEFYDLGEAIVALQVFKDRLFVATKDSLYYYDGKKYKRISKAITGGHKTKKVRRHVSKI